MLLSVISAVAMGFMFMRLVGQASLSSTRRLAVLPLTACVMEVIATGALHPAAFPWLTVALVALRAAILVGCEGVLRKDKQHQRRRQRQRAAARVVALEERRQRPMGQRRVTCA